MKCKRCYHSLTFGHPDFTATLEQKVLQMWLHQNGSKRKMFIFCCCHVPLIPNGSTSTCSHAWYIEVFSSLVHLWIKNYLKKKNPFQFVKTVSSFCLHSTHHILNNKVSFYWIVNADEGCILDICIGRLLLGIRGSTLPLILEHHVRVNPTLSLDHQDILMLESDWMRGETQCTMVFWDDH